MPLPPALVARLQKRGIIKNTQPEEEVFAEAYDKKDSSDESETEDSHKKRGGAPGCPNKWNQYHLCTDYCYDRWEEGVPESRLPPSYKNEKLNMLLRYPLPDGWQEVYDPGLCRHYYWNPSTDLVCWLSPTHPHANVGQSAQALAKEFFESKTHNIDDDETVSRDKPRRNERHRDDGDRMGNRRRDREQMRDEPSREKRRDESNLALIQQQQEEPLELDDRARLKRARKRGLDPMDPAAYGDAPEGNWSSGLVAEAKTGVDVTASGPLFQSRPYPAPSAVLRRNNPEKKD